MFSYQFSKISKSTFFIEHPQLLLLPLDSQRQLCKRISKLVTIYFISTFLILVGIFVFILARTSFAFMSRWHVTTQLKCHVTFWVSSPHPDSAPFQVLGARGLANVNTKHFCLTRDHVIDVSLYLVGEVPSSWFSTLPSFGGQGSCEYEDKIFLTWHLTTSLMCHLT